MSADPTVQLPVDSSIKGGLSGKTIRIPDVDVAPMPLLGPSGVICNGTPAEGFGAIKADPGYPDVLSFRRKFGLLLPATNTSMEHELWRVMFNNQGPAGLRGVGFHSVGVSTPNPRMATEADQLEYRHQFLSGLRGAVEMALLAQPQYLILGMSLDQIIGSIAETRSVISDVEEFSGLSWATWHDAAPAALEKYQAKRIGLLTPYDQIGNTKATRLFEEFGFEVVASVGFSCAHALHIAHVPDWAKEKAILELLATSNNSLDAIVQCGTNMSLIDVCEKLEPRIGIPIIASNTATLWYALRENGFSAPLEGAGRLLREF